MSGHHSRTPLVLLHSAFFNGEQFDRLIPCFPGHPVFTPTYAGQNGMPLPDGILTMERLAQELVETLRRRFSQPVHVLGNSMGAFVALHACAQAPQLFRTATLMATTSSPESHPERFTGLAEAVEAAGVRNMAPKIAEMMFGESFFREHAEEVKKWTRFFGGAQPTIVETMRAIYMRTDMRPLLSGLQVPLLLLSGDEDRVRRPAEMAEMATLKPGSVFCNIARAGHTLVLEQPEEVASLVKAWWRYLRMDEP